MLRLWKNFNINNLDEYQNQFNIGHVLLLSNVSGNFRKNIHKKYDFDPVIFVTILLLSWTSTIKLTKKELELLTDILHAMCI